MRTIRLNGALGKKYGRIHRLDVQSPAEALRALIANHPDMHGDLIRSADNGVGYRCVLDGDAVDEEALSYPLSKTFTITPVVMGAGAVGKIIAGVALIAAAVVLSPAVVGAAGPTLGMGTSIGFAGLTYANIAWLGVAITLAGVTQLLTPLPTLGKDEKAESKFFNGPVNVTAQGVPVPIGYGRLIVGSAVISAGITVEQEFADDFSTWNLMPNFYGGNFPA